MKPDALQRVHEPREVIDALRWIVRAGTPSRLLPTNFPPWVARFRRLAKDYERRPEMVVGLHFVAFACLMLHRFIAVISQDL